MTARRRAVIPAFVDRVLRREPPVIHGDGEQSRDFTYVANVVDGTVLAMTAPADRIAPGVFNIAAGGRHSVNEMLLAISEILGIPTDPVHTEPRAGDIRHSQADISRARAALGYEPRISFREGLERTVDFFRKGGEPI